MFLADVQLTGISIGGVGTTITANLPVGVSAGSYRVTVSQPSGAATFDVTLGAQALRDQRDLRDLRDRRVTPVFQVHRVRRV